MALVFQTKMGYFCEIFFFIEKFQRKITEFADKFEYSP